MLVHIAKTNGVLFSGEADALTAPGSEGEVTILPHHMQLATVLRRGTLIVKKGGVVIFEHDIENGILEVTPESATVLL
jgi:F-type H+-transporting ATPase subunit epsilon